MADPGDPSPRADGAGRAHRLAAGVRAGEMRAIGRAISEVERDSEAGRRLVGALADAMGRAHRIGVTGPPGAGKSTLVGALVAALERLGRRVGVIAVDPSSRVTGGAILGDRLRMDRHGGGPGVFIRSLGSRGESGGLSLAATRAADVLDAAGYDPVIIETVGAGQAEIEVGEIAHTRVVVLPPGSGDDVQAVKAGMMEIADIFVVSKCDAPGAEHTRSDLLAMLRLRGDESPRPEVIGTSVVDGRGIGSLVEALSARAALRTPGLVDGALARLVVRRALRATETALARLPASRLLDLGARVHRGDVTLAAAADAALDAAREAARVPAADPAVPAGPEPA